MTRERAVTIVQAIAAVSTYHRCMSDRPTSGSATLMRIAREAMHARGLLPELSRAARSQTDRITEPARGGASILDLTGLLWASIDNDDSRDLDQLSVAEALADGAVKILVAIADVDELVKKATPIDDHAWTNTTSVYTAAGIFPMLPEKLSTNLTSLAEDQERLAIVVEMTVGADGAVSAPALYRARVLNHAKLAYNSVAAWLDGTAPPPPRVASVVGLADQLRLQDGVAQRLRQRRHERGALRLETIEARPVYSDGELADLLPDEKNRAKELIEDFMVAANEVTARFLAAHGFAALRRVLRTPKRWERIVALAADLGEQLPATPNSAALDRFLAARRAADPLRFPDLSLAVIKLLGSGEYAVDIPGRLIAGHFGLAVRDYTHSTAPNRRFPDLVSQRLVKAALAGERPPYAEDELAALAHHCTEQEDNADKVERQVRKSAAAQLLAPRLVLRRRCHRRLGEGNLGADLTSDDRGTRRPRCGPARRRRPGARSTHLHRRRTRQIGRAS